MSNLDEPIWDGNGGVLDPRTATQKELLVALHIKVDNILAPGLRDHETRVRKLESFQGRILGACTFAVVLLGLVAALIEARYVG